MASLDLDQVRAMRMASPNKEHFNNGVRHFERVHANINICTEVEKISEISLPKEIDILDPMEEIA